mmetsp:Transcript_72872/g.206114  ORF Transcript_72872/g.206114 Transcript_72872/m.206114 type:complete len:266 (-) Transcript_72872:468-1265(-)
MGLQHVARGRERHVQSVGFPAHELFEQVDKMRHVYWMSIAQVVDLERRRLPGGPDVVHGAQAALDDVVDVGEVALQLGAARPLEDLDRLALADLVGEGKGRHVRAPVGAVDGEEPQPRQREAVDVVVGVRDHLVGLLRRGVQACWPVDCICLGEGDLRVQPIHRARGGVDHAGHGPLLPGRLQEGDEARHVGRHVGVRGLGGVPHSRLGGQVQHVGEPAGFHRAPEGVDVVQVRVQGENPVGLLELGRAAPLQALRVVRVEVVES